MSKRENSAEQVQTATPQQDEQDPVTYNNEDLDPSSDHVETSADQADPEAPSTEQEQQGDLRAMEAQLEQLRKENEEYQQKWLRAQADFDNFRRRSRQEKEEFAKYASLQLVEQLLPIIDNFDRAMTSSKETSDFDSLAKGLDMIYRQLEQVLSAEGLQVMETVGKPFDPEFHQAVAQVESEEYDEGIVVGELQRGYILKDKVIRPAMVQVSK